MTTDAAEGGTPAPGTERMSRLERRKARTRQKLITAARVMLADDRATSASIQDITEQADVGFGSFYNHFTSKVELFRAAVEDVLEEAGQLFDLLSGGGDPAADFARSVRLAIRLGRERPEVAQILVRHGMSYATSDRGLAPRALRDIRAGIETGDFQVQNAQIALASVAGSLLAVLSLSLTEPGAVDDDACDQLAEQLLRMLGVPHERAGELATAPLPALPAEPS